MLCSILKYYYKVEVIMKRLVFLFVSVVMLIAAFAGCASTQPAVSSSAPASASSAAVSSSAAPVEKTLAEESWDEITAKAKTQSLVFYHWWGEDFWPKICADFKTKYGIEVSYASGDQSASTDKMVAEKDQPKASIDLVAVGGTGVLTTMNAKVFVPNICSMLPDTSKLTQGLMKTQEGVTTDGTLIPLYRNQTGMIYNPEKVTAAPQTWAELEAFIDANPKRFGICPPEAGGTGQAFVQTAIGTLTGGYDQYMGDATADASKVAKWETVWKWFNDRKDKIVITKSNADSAARLNQGELWLTVLWSDDTFISMSKGELSKSFVFYIPKMGLPGGGDTMGIAANSQNKELALFFANYLVSEEVQQKMSAELNTIPALTDMVVKDTVIKNEEMVNSTAWIPSCYKTEFIKLFTEKVLS
jgi:putative spermidine/putrescine transport system substrate-binding protein